MVSLAVGVRSNVHAASSPHVIATDPCLEAFFQCHYSISLPQLAQKLEGFLINETEETIAQDDQNVGYLKSETAELIGRALGVWWYTRSLSFIDNIVNSACHWCSN